MKKGRKCPLFILLGNIQIDDTVSAGIDNLRLSALTGALEIEAIALVHVAVRHQGGLILVDDVQEGFKTSVRKIGIVAQLIRRRMRQQNIDAFGAPESKAQSVQAALHLAFGVLMFPE